VKISSVDAVAWKRWGQAYLREINADMPVATADIDNLCVLERRPG
jgi:hypothetical protein